MGTELLGMCGVELREGSIELWVNILNWNLLLYLFGSFSL